MIDILKDYAAKRIDLLRMEATEKSVNSAGILTFIIFSLMSCLFFVLMLNLGLGFLIGGYLGNYGVGILIMAAIYLIQILILFKNRKLVQAKVANFIIDAIND